MDFTGLPIVAQMVVVGAASKGGKFIYPGGSFTGRPMLSQKELVEKPHLRNW
jgi:hypothetical protein